MNAILAALLSQAWALDELTMDKLVAVITRWSDGVRLSAADVQAAVGSAPQAAADRRDAAASSGGSVAVLPLYGVVSHRARMVTQVSGPGGTSNEAFGQAFRQAMADPNVSAILIDTDSPGGSVAGTPELSAMIHDARGTKPIVASANHLMASAAYYIASAADEIVAIPSAMVGSVGVIAAHEDRSGELAASGRRITYVTAGKYKAEGASTGPLTDEAAAYMQHMVDQAYATMVKDIARNRGIAPEVVRKQYGEGRALSAQDALAAGMVDRIETFDETIARLSNPRRRSRIASNRNALKLAQLS